MRTHEMLTHRNVSLTKCPLVGNDSSENVTSTKVPSQKPFSRGGVCTGGFLYQEMFCRRDILSRRRFVIGNIAVMLLTVRFSERTFSMWKYLKHSKISKYYQAQVTFLYRMKSYTVFMSWYDFFSPNLGKHFCDNVHFDGKASSFYSHLKTSELSAAKLPVFIPTSKPPGFP